MVVLNRVCVLISLLLVSVLRVSTAPIQTHHPRTIHNRLRTHEDDQKENGYALQLGVFPYSSKFGYTAKGR